MKKLLPIPLAKRKAEQEVLVKVVDYLSTPIIDYCAHHSIRYVMAVLKYNSYTEDDSHHAGATVRFTNPNIAALFETNYVEWQHIYLLPEDNEQERWKYTNALGDFPLEKQKEV